MSRSAWLALAAATALVLMLTRALDPAVRFWTAALMVPLPALMIVQSRQLREMDALPRGATYTSSIGSLWLLLGATFAVTMYARLELPPLVALPAPYLVMATLALTAACLVVLLAFHAVGAVETDVLRALLPETTGEKLAFVLVSVTAGICEELVFRGFLQTALTTATGSPWVALALASGTFGVVHAYQSSVGALRAAIIGVILGLPVVLGAGLLPSIAAHTLVDVLSGIFLARRLLR